MAMQVDFPDATLGAVVTGVALSTLDDDAFARILALWHERAVLVFPGQHLDDDDHIAFSARFGRFERGLKQSSVSKLGVLSNVARDGSVAPPTSLQARFHLGNLQWHSDSSYKSVGAKASLLNARVVPSEGGETEWADMRAAWDALSPAMQRRLDGAIAVHSYAYSHAWHGGLEIVNADDLAALAPVQHPVVAKHPATGRRSLFIGRHASYLVREVGEVGEDALGEAEAASRALLQQLTEAACQPPRLWKHRWRAGDIAIWDNRCLLHRGHAWPADQPRTMVRTTIAGDAPDNPWAMPATD
jgi:alpha-ketoglutarate-dependent taurine dioxygenase